MPRSRREPARNRRHADHRLGRKHQELLRTPTSLLLQSPFLTKNPDPHANRDLLARRNGIHGHLRLRRRLPASPRPFRRRKTDRRNANRRRGRHAAPPLVRPLPAVYIHALSAAASVYTHLHPRQHHRATHHSPHPIPIPSPSPHQNPIAAIVGGVVGGLLFLSLLIIGALFLRWRKRKTNVAKRENVQHAELPSYQDSKDAAAVEAPAGPLELAPYRPREPAEMAGEELDRFPTEGDEGGARFGGAG